MNDEPQPITSDYRDAKLQDLLQLFVTPLAPYFIADHYIATELTPGNPKYVDCDFRPTARDFLAHKDVSEVADGDIVQVQVDLLGPFVAQVLPILRLQKKRIVLFTSQWWMPSIERSEFTDELRREPSIALWISQNPIYPTCDTYMAFPYGLNHVTLPEYVAIRRKLDSAISRHRKITNLPSTVHPHLPANHIRRRYSRLGRDAGNLLPYDQFLAAIRESCFAISTVGDRPDTYRHYECIGLGTIPVSTLPNNYVSIFGESMLICTADELDGIVDHPERLPPYHPPDSRIISLHHWQNKISDRQASIA